MENGKNRSLKEILENYYINNMGNYNINNIRNRYITETSGNCYIKNHCGKKTWDKKRKKTGGEVPYTRFSNPPTVFVFVA
jgi:hypothetical protein